MSQPTEIRKSILILKSQAKGLTAVETFLRNREWHIHATSDLKSALVYLVQHKPSFVMISVDHPNKKVRNLPKLLGQAFPVFVMAFTESSSTTAYKHLVECGTNYKINPPVTGPAVERTINKIIRDQQVEQEKRERGGREGDPSGAGGANAGDRITISGSGGAGGDFTPGGGPDAAGVVGGGGATSNSAADIIRRMMSGEGDADADQDGDPAVMGDASNAGPSVIGSLGGASDAVEDPANAGGPMILGQSLPNQREALILDPNDPRKGESGDPAIMGSSLTGGPAVMIAKGERAELHQAEQEGLAPDLGPAGFIPGQEPLPDQGPVGQPGVVAPSLSARSSGPGRGPGGLVMPEGAGPGEAMPLPSGDSAEDGNSAPGVLGSTTPRRQASLGSSAPQAMYSEEDFEERGHRGTADDGSEPPPPVIGGMSGPKARGQAAENDSPQGKPHDSHETLNQEIHKVGKRSAGWEKSESIMVRGTQRALDESVTVKEGHRDEDTVRIESATNVACLIVESPKFSGYLVAALGKNRKVDEKFVNVIRDRLFRFLRESGEQVEAENNMSLKIKKVDFEDWALEYADFLRKSVHDGEEIAMAFFPFADAKTDLEESAAVDMGAVKMEDLKGDVSVEFNLYIYLPSNKKYVLYTPRNSTFYGNQKDRLSRMGVTHMHVKKTELQDVSKYRAQNYLNSKIEEFESRRKGKRSSVA